MATEEKFYDILKQIHGTENAQVGYKKINTQRGIIYIYNIYVTVSEKT